MEYVLDPTERRIIGVLIEKESTTPDGYPLTLQALVAACNQKSNRDPVASYQSFEIEGALRSLFQKRWATTSNFQGRTERWKHRLTEHIRCSREAIAVLAELLLRGSQQPGELRARARRMAPGLATAADLSRAVDELASMSPPLATTLPPRPGERTARIDHRLYPPGETAAEIRKPGDETPREHPPLPAASELERRLEHLEREVAEIRRILSESGGA